MASPVSLLSQSQAWPASLKPRPGTGRSVRAALALTVLLLAGCLDSGPRDGAGSPPDRPDHLQVTEFPVSVDHDHTDSAAHAAFAGIERIGHVAASAGNN